MSTLSQKHVALLTDYEPNSALNIAYQALYTNITLSWKQRNGQHTVLLTTPAAYPEQSIVAANTAIASARNGTHTILVDADLHAPILQRFFGINVPGLSDLLSSQDQEFTSQNIAAYLSKTAVPDLLLLSGGQKQPAPGEIGRFFSSRFLALLSSLHQLLQETESNPGLIIFACPPVLSGIDASLISSQVEQTFLVIVSGHTTRTQARKAQEQLQKAHANIEGMILLDV